VIRSDDGVGDKGTPGTPFSETIPLTYTFQVAEFPLLLGVQQLGNAVAVLDELYLTRVTATGWNATVSAQVLDTTSGDSVNYKLHYYVGGNQDVF
jgi:hypothetical protein